MKEFKLTIISPEASLYEDMVDSIVLPTLSGYIGVLPGHTPMVSVLSKGEIQIKKDTSVEKIFLNGGIIDISPEEVSIISS